MSCLQHGWPEPIVRVQSLSESGLSSIPHRYIKPPSQRPSIPSHPQQVDTEPPNIPLIDIADLLSAATSGGVIDHNSPIMNQISEACREWGFLQVVNHGLSVELMDRTLQLWRQFFSLPVEEKQVYANTPLTYEGYGSRLGVEKGAILDWSDYFFLQYLPYSVKDPNKWPNLPTPIRETIEEYCGQLVKLCGTLMKLFSINLGLGEDRLPKAFGGDDIGACLRANFYPKCPQPDLTLGLSPHSDPGGMTILLPDDHVAGLQVRRGDSWVTVKVAPGALVVNIGDQIQVLSNAIYKSIEHRVIVNSAKDRSSLAFFYNPKSDMPMEPLKELVTLDCPPLYKTMTYDEYRLLMRMKGPSGKSHVDSLKSLQHK
ncbi:jasmonate-induced oxygenase 1-like [Macadamia integrifolia]|uniref:jasmonate-induced oxygenase 1-like n=1 Tax=Macadamia integrifolia TaxID=60698 RepID=UPI001C4FB3E1|nr:jasmonate-induced oxygenase 1-like [Macadamia integrifolia]